MMLRITNCRYPVFLPQFHLFCYSLAHCHDSTLGINIIMMRVRSFCIMFLAAITTLSTTANPLNHTGDSSTENPAHTSPSSTMETGLLQARPDYTGDILGARVERITVDETSHIQIIEISVPIDPDRVDQINVISDSGELIRQDRTAQILHDYENNNVGIKIYVPEQKNWVFKLKLIDQADSHPR